MERSKKVKIYAHRGAQQGAPENSFAALELAAVVGAKYIEFDVQLTRDGGLVIVHDEKLDRVALRKGKVADMDYSELIRIDIGSWFSLSFCNETIPGFIPWMQAVLKTDLIPNIELKLNSRSPILLADRVAAYWRDNWPKDRELRISSFSFQVLKAIQAAGYAGEIAFLANTYSADHLNVLKALKACAYHVNGKKIRPKEVRMLKEKGYEVLAYTLNQRKDAQAFIAAGGDGFFTNNLGLINEF